MRERNKTQRVTSTHERQRVHVRQETSPATQCIYLSRFLKTFITSPFGHYYTFYFIIRKEKTIQRQREISLSFKNECLSSYILHCFKCNKGNTHFFMNNIFQNFNTAESAWKLSKALSSAALYKIFKNPKCCMV